MIALEQGRAGKDIAERVAQRGIRAQNRRGAGEQPEVAILRRGSVVAQGSGTITGNRIEYRFDSYDEGSGSGVMTVSDDGRSMVGRYTLASGATGTATLLR